MGANVVRLISYPPSMGTGLWRKTLGIKKMLEQHFTA